MKKNFFNENLIELKTKIPSFYEIPILWKWNSGCWSLHRNKQIRIDHQNKYIFVHIPKTAGTSITHALQEAQFPYNSKGTRFRCKKHTPALTLKKHIGFLAWKTHFKFAFVRNPWDLMVSSYCWWLNKGRQFDESIAQKAKQVEKFDNFKQFLLSDLGKTHINEIEAQDLSHWICDENGKIIVDFVGKVENLEQDLEYIFRQLGTSCPKLKKKNASQRNDYRKYYDRETKTLIEKRFKWTIENFNYQF
jgi:hypothetical protein